MSRTNISWSEFSWNFLGGCSPVSEGCKHCWAARQAYGRLKNYPLYKGLTANGHWIGEIRLCTDIGRQDLLEAPLHWKDPQLIFVQSMGDLFHPSVPFEFIKSIFCVIESCQRHIFQILTKHPTRTLEFISDWKIKIDYMADSPAPPEGMYLKRYSNLWIGVSCENQKCADERIPILLQIPAAVRFVSLEPLLGDMIIPLKGVHWQVGIKEEKIHQVIIGAESRGGWPGRECKLEWVRNIVRQCDAAGVPVHIKQLHLWKVKWVDQLFETIEDAKLHCGEDICTPKRVLVKDINQFPEDLRRRELPKGQIK